MADILIPEALSLSDLNTAIDQEPRLLDLRIAERLGYERPRVIRELIERNRDEIETYGSIAVRHGAYRGHTFSEFWLNEAQTLLICMFSKTSKAAAIRSEVISVFIAFRRGKAPGNPAADERRQKLARSLMADLRQETNSEVRHFLYAMLEAVAGEMGLTAPPITSMGRDAPQQPDILTPFWARIDALLADQAKIDHSRNPNLLALNLVDLRKRHGMAIEADLRQALKLSLSPRFIALRAVCSALTGRTVKCWLFARSFQQTCTFRESC